MKFTVTAIRALKPRAARYEILKDNGNGLAIRVSPSGIKSFVYLYRIGGRSRRMTLGRFPDLSLADANRLHAEAAKVLKTGGDPGAAAQNLKRADRAAETVADLSVEFMTRYINKNRRRPDHAQHILDKNILPVLGRRKAKDVTRRDVVLLLDDIVDRGAPIMANRTASTLTQMFRFAVERDILETSPCIYLKKPGGREKPRVRNLTWDEIRLVWTNCGEITAHRSIQIAIKLLLVTGQRRGEVCGAEWAEVDIAGRVWLQPAAKTKNGVANEVPLSDLAVDLFSDLRVIAGNSKFVIPSPGRHEIPITPRAVTRAVARNRAVFGVDRWVPHDLRRTVTSRMREMGISPVTIDKIQNHLEQGVIKHYDHHDYAHEKRTALDAWAAKIESLIEPSAGNIVSFLEGK